MKHIFLNLLLNQDNFIVESDPTQTFWTNVRKYTSSKSNDEPFVSEVAYMMVTLHRTGAQ